MDKAELRKAMTAYMRGMRPAELAANSRRVARHFTAAQAWKDAEVVLAFLSLPYEIDTTPIIVAARTAGRAVAVPRIEDGDIRFVVLPPDAGDLPRDRWGIPVPGAAWPALDLTAPACVLVATPGLAFDRAGNRLGRGKGYYDRFLGRARLVARRLIAVGICFSGQVVREVPHGEDDQRVDAVITDEGTLTKSP